MGHSTLQMPCGCGTKTVATTWYFPNQAQPPVGVIYLQHGFLRSSANDSALAIHLAQTTNSIVVTPDITSNFFTPDGFWLGGSSTAQSVADLFAGNRAALTASASQAAGKPVTLPDKYVLAGHSGGGGLVAAAAADAVNGGTAGNLAGVILLDGVSLTDTMPASLTTLHNAGVEVLQIASAPSLYNSFGSGTSQLITAYPDQFKGVTLVGGTHLDAEGVSAGWPAQLAVAFSTPANEAAVQLLTTEWINDMYAGTPIEGPSSPISIIPTQGGPATVVSLPNLAPPFANAAGALPNLAALFERVFIGALQPAAL